MINLFLFVIHPPLNSKFSILLCAQRMHLLIWPVRSPMSKSGSAPKWSASSCLFDPYSSMLAYTHTHTLAQRGRTCDWGRCLWIWCAASFMLLPFSHSHSVSLTSSGQQRNSQGNDRGKHSALAYIINILLYGGLYIHCPQESRTLVCQLTEVEMVYCASGGVCVLCESGYVRCVSVYVCVDG